MIRTRWVKRDAEWIKANPKKPTMYKEEYDDGIEELKEVDSSPRSEKDLVDDFIYRRKWKPDAKVPKWEEVKRVQNTNVYGEPIVRDEDRKRGKDAGVYAIVCEPAKFVYVGQSVSMDTRMRNHKMNILKEGLPSSRGMRVYMLMQEHRGEFGLDSFQFIKHTVMPYASEEDLLARESHVMCLYQEDGYQLYNLDCGGNMYCPHDLKPLIFKLMDKIINDPLMVDKIKALID